MGAIRYFEVKGGLLEKFKELFRQRQAGIEALNKWAKSHGGKLAANDTSWGCFGVAIICEEGETPKNPQHWKPYKHVDNCWSPRLSTKEGKKIYEEMGVLARAVPTTGDFGALIKYNPFSGFPNVRGIGVTFTKDSSGNIERIFVSVPDDKFEIKKGIELERISDLEYEKLTEDRQETKKRRRA